MRGPNFGIKMNGKFLPLVEQSFVGSGVLVFVF